MRLAILPAYFLLVGSLHSQGLGRVVADHTGEPLASAEIEVVRDGSPQVLAELESDSGGRFALPELTPGSYRFQIDKPGYLPVTLHLDWSAKAIPPLARLVRYGVISGRVLDLDGQPVAHVYVSAIDVAEAAARPYPTKVNPDGTFRLFGLPPGHYRVLLQFGASNDAVGTTGETHLGAHGSGVTLYPPGAAARVFTVSGGEDYHDIDFTVAPNALFRVSGLVDATARPADFWAALVSEANPDYSTAVTIADKDGQFRFDGVPGGTYSLVVYGPSAGRSSAGAILPEHPLFGRIAIDVKGDTVNATVTVGPGRTISLQLRSKDRACQAGADWVLSPREDWVGRNERTVHVTPNKPEMVKDLAPARYAIMPAASDEACFPAAYLVIDLRNGGNERPVLVDAAASGSLHVTAPVAAVQPFLFLAEAPSAAIEVNNTDASGQFTYSALRPGRYRVALVPPGGNASWMGRVAAMQEVIVQPGKTADVRLVPVPEESK